VAAEDYIDFDDYWEDSRDGNSRGMSKGMSKVFPPTAEAPSRGSAWTSEQEVALERLWSRGYTLADLAAKFGRTTNGIIARLEKLGHTVEGNQVRTLTKQPKKEVKFMANVQHLITLLQEGYTTVEVTFSGSSQRYTYKAPLSMGLAIDDKVVVPARDEFKVTTVREVHDAPEIDVSKPFDLKWVVQKVDTAAYDDQAKREAEAVRMIQVAERRKAQEDALEAILGSTDREALLKLIKAS
jgi:hypothetical protein